MTKFVFLDRDGVINRDSPLYIKSSEEFDFLPGSLEAFGLLARHGYKVIIITNQSVIGRGMVSPHGLDQIFETMTRQITSMGGNVHDIFFCPHVPDDQCDCRKPKPGMILAAHKKHRMDLKKTVMIGDSAKDMQCARNAGVGSAVLVLTGNGPKALAQLKGSPDAPDVVADNLLDAVTWLVQQNTDESP